MFFVWDPHGSYLVDSRQPDKIHDLGIENAISGAFSPDGRTLAVSVKVTESVYLIDMATRAVQHKLSLAIPFQLEFPGD
jgi:hypothetical protein